ncbi:MAG: Methyltransferase type 11, partial [Firmicutes bacterium]|nr:Methyltransferase type 11 [Bacillota bacterium]
FKQGGWNCYSHPDPMDMPAPLFDHLQWLQEAGFHEVDCFWQRGGHAVFGGYNQG